MASRLYRAWLGLLCCACAASALEQPSKEEFLTKIVMKSLGSWHYAPPKIDDAFSKKLFALQLKRMDPQKRFLIKEDVDSLEKFQTKIDDELRDGNSAFLDYSMILLRNRIRDAQSLADSVLDGPLNMEAEDSLALEPDKQPYAKNRVELRQRWARLLKYQILTHIQDVKESKEKEEKDSLKDKSKAKPPAPDAKAKEKAKPPKPMTAKEAEDAEKDAKGYVKRSTKRLFDRMLKEDRFERVAAYLNNLSNTYDPHTEYFKPEAKEDFDLSMTGTLEGIGAVLREEDGFIKVVSIVPGSASWRQKELKAEDKILKVAQGEEEPVDIVEASVNEAVRLIRGKKGTEVRLTVQKPSGRIQVIPIIRDVVIVEETYARSAVVTPTASKHKFGYINLPAFYHDFNNSKGRTASTDVQNELEKLKAEKVEGVVLDLRLNGGGALDDAVKMAGLFFKAGPVVQIKDQKGFSTVLQDVDTSVTYDGPLVVMVNTFSASASEIVAAALQDYGRAVILGTDTTFGKGTVQSMLDLDAYLPQAYANFRPMGSLKLTIQKFYRINGGTTQYKGVVPDVLIPDAYSNLDVGEKTLEYAMPWDTVAALSFARWKEKPDLTALKRKSAARLKADPFFRQLYDMTEKLEKQRERPYLSLKKSKFFQEQETARKETERFETLQKENAALAVTPVDRSDGTPSDSLEEEKGKHWQEQLARDYYLREAVNVLGDITTK